MIRKQYTTNDIKQWNDEKRDLSDANRRREEKKCGGCKSYEQEVTDSVSISNESRIQIMTIVIFAIWFGNLCVNKQLVSLDMVGVMQSNEYISSYFFG